VLLALLYSRLDVRAVVTAFTAARTGMLTLAIATTIPINLLIAWRFYLTAPPGSLPGYFEALRLTLVAKALNMFLPSKSGDLVKSYFVAKRGNVPAGVALSLIAYERLCDLVGLLTWCLAGFFVSPPPQDIIGSSVWMFLAGVTAVCLVLVTSQRSASWLLSAVHRLLPSRRLQKLRDLAAGWPSLHIAIGGRRRWILLISIAVWLVNMLQWWVLTLVVSAPIPFAAGLGIFALAVAAGQLPLTFAGFGARDVAIVVLSSHYMRAEAAAAVALLSASLGFIPALAAVPFIRPYVAVAAGDAARWRHRRTARHERQPQ